MKTMTKLVACLAFALIASAAATARAEDQDGYPPQAAIEARQVHATHSLRNMNCQPEAPVQQVVVRETVIAPPVLFAPASDKLTPAAKASIKHVAAILKTPAYRGHHVILSGYTDNKGKDASNQRLSYHRAVMVLKQLVQDGVPAALLKAQGFGKENPVAPNATPQGRALNRRVTFTLDNAPVSRPMR